MKKNEYGDWRLAYLNKSVYDLKLADLNYDLNILDDMAVLAVISFLSEDMSIRVFNLVVELSESRKFSRTKRIFAINTLYEQAISKGFTIKACVLPHEQARAFSLFCVTYTIATKTLLEWKSYSNRLWIRLIVHSNNKTF